MPAETGNMTGKENISMANGLIYSHKPILDGWALQHTVGVAVIQLPIQIFVGEKNSMYVSLSVEQTSQIGSVILNPF